MTATADAIFVMKRSTTQALIAVLFVAVLALIVSLLAELRSGVIASKMLASSTFLAIALSCGAGRARYGRIILAGLVFSWFGDLFLLGAAPQLFLLGLVSFLIAHVAYVSAFASLGLNRNWLFVALIPVALASMSASAWLTPHVADDMLLPVRVYTAVISVMVIASVAARGNGATTLIPLGAVLFYLSDLSVAAGQFVHTGFPNYVWGLPFYYAGQTLLALSISSTVSAIQERQSARD